jgi:hypothetical protein
VYRPIASISIAATAAIALVLGATVASGQRPEPCCPKYDVAGEVTVQGVIEKVETRYSQNGNAGIHLVVRSGETVYDVHVGPKKYYSKQKVELAAQDTITMIVAPVSGAQPAAGAPKEVVAREIRRGDEVLSLREANGAPRWRRSAT